MLDASYIHSIYSNHVNQAAAEKLQRVQEYTGSIIAAMAESAARGQRAKFVKYDDIPRDIVQAVKSELLQAGFTVKTHLINGYQKIEIRF